MERRFTSLATAFLLIATVTIQAEAADNVSLVKVALNDMSATMGMGPAGQGMMGRGMMGQGMMDQGMMGPGMMGPGMMGSGMMTSMMAIRINQHSVKAGAVRFDVTNWSRGMLHEMLIVPVDNPQAPLPYDYTAAKVEEDQVKVLGDTGDLQPGASNTVDVTLTPGSYLLICNLPGHYAAGMATPLTVTP